jgi:histidinol phosphatase-like enzyme (inositol monophosphatase family)
MAPEPLPPSADLPPVDERLLDDAVRWARTAGFLTLGWFRANELWIDHKEDGTPVTEADREAEALLRRLIGQAYPDDAIIGEEEADRPGTSGRTWVVDPIDGTKAFSCGVATYANLVYLADEHGPAAGVINLPALGETIWAGRGRGCHLNGLPTGVAGPSDPRRAPVLCTSSVDSITAEVFQRVNDVGVQLRTWGDAYGYALVASGRVSAMFDPLMAWWDLAPMTVIIPEAGGTLTRWDGGDDTAAPTRPEPYPYSAIASDGLDHPRWVELLRP